MGWLHEGAGIGQVGQGGELQLWGCDTNIICKALGAQSRFQFHCRLVEREHPMLSGTQMLVAAMTLVLVACPSDAEPCWGHLFQRCPSSTACSAALGQLSMS